jgi:serine/threonine protein kinase
MGGAVTEPGELSAEIERYADLVDRLFCRADARYGGYSRIKDPVVVVPDVIARVGLNRQGDLSDTYELAIYRGIEGFAAELWEREVRSLLRLESLNHPGLPTIVDGTFDVTEKIAFTLTRDSGEAADHAEVVAWARANPIEAVEQFSILLDALDRLHGSRILHRNLTPGALRFTWEGERVRLKLTRFELSALIGNLIRQVGRRGGTATRDFTRRLYLTPEPGVDLALHMAYLAPELYPHLFDAAPGVRREWATTDVFGLGVLAWEWFCGPLAVTLPVPYGAVAEAAGDEAGTTLVPALERLHDAMRAHLTANPEELPEPLTRLLGHMLDRAPSGRRTAFELNQALNRDWEAIRARWEYPTDERPLVLAFMPDQSTTTIYADRHWISRSPLEAAGRDELKAFLEKELRQAELVHSPTGALGYASGPEDALREAEYVLVGERAVWFCAYLYDERMSGQRDNRYDEALVIKYFKDIDRAQEVANAYPRRRVGRVELMAFRPRQRVGDQLKGRRSWRPLTDAVVSRGFRDPEDQKWLQSLDFLLTYHRITLDARTYPVKRVDDRALPNTALYQLDPGRDSAWRHRTPLLMTYCVDRRRRPPLGDFYRDLALHAEDQVVKVNLVAGRGDRPFFGSKAKAVEFEGRVDEDTIRVKGRDLPDDAWLQPAEDSGTTPQLSRQARARLVLKDQGQLVRNLRDPLSYDLGSGRQDFDSGTALLGDAPDRIRQLLALQPFYALQGPPGTGKTTVAAAAVRQYLRREPGARVLVSAQSNFALDNLGKRLVRELPPDTLVLRETPEQLDPDKVDPAILPHTLTPLTARLVEDIRRRLTRRLSQGGTDSPLTVRDAELARTWLAALDASEAELSERIRSGASVVLATCSIAATVLDSARDPTELFDWVIVEEAAKAWPTELIVPLVMGVRWALIGDHRQLGAHRQEELRQFLDSLRGNQDEDVRPHYEQRADRLRVMNLFASLFEDRTAPAGRHVVPLGRLSMQFRMHSRIAEPMRRAFYQEPRPRLDPDGLPESFLGSHFPVTDRGHGVTAPAFLADRPLVWLDTSDRADCADLPRWSNPGEVRLVEALVERMRPGPAPAGQEGDAEGGLVVLTPYLMQLRKLNSRGLLLNRVHTVHSFQGREADRVVVSLVRTSRQGDGVSQNVGHVGQDEVVNVLLSRARRLLVIVGSFKHFREYGGPSWDTVTRAVERYGTVVPADELDVT